MPLPKPSDDETQDDFMSRCMSELSGEFKEPGQRFKVCEGLWDENKAEAKNMPHPRIERRHLPSESVAMITREDGGTTISGYAAVFYRSNDPGTEFDLWDGVTERIMPGAFDAAIERDDVRALFNHDPNHVLGRTSAGTLRLSKNKRGLAYEIDLPNTQLARDLATSIGRGDISGSSIGMVVTGEAWRSGDEGEVREITDVELYDVSPVTYPAYKSTTSGIRSEELVEARSRYQAWRDEKTTEEQLQQLQEENEQLKDENKWLRAKLLTPTT